MFNLYGFWEQTSIMDSISGAGNSPFANLKKTTGTPSKLKLEFKELNQQAIQAVFGLDKRQPDTLLNAIKAICKDAGDPFDALLRPPKSAADLINAIGQAVHQAQKNSVFNDTHRQVAQNMYSLLKAARKLFGDNHEVFTGFKRDQRGEYQRVTQAGVETTVYTDESRTKSAGKRDDKFNQTAWTSYFKDALAYQETVDPLKTSDFEVFGNRVTAEESQKILVRLGVRAKDQSVDSDQVREHWKSPVEATSGSDKILTSTINDVKKALTPDDASPEVAPSRKVGGLSDASPSRPSEASSSAENKVDLNSLTLEEKAALRDFSIGLRKDYFLTETGPAVYQDPAGSAIDKKGKGIKASGLSGKIYENLNLIQDGGSIPDIKSTDSAFNVKTFTNNGQDVHLLHTHSPQFNDSTTLEEGMEQLTISYQSALNAYFKKFSDTGHQPPLRLCCISASIYGGALVNRNYGKSGHIEPSVSIACVAKAIAQFKSDNPSVTLPTIDLFFWESVGDSFVKEVEENIRLVNGMSGRDIKISKGAKQPGKEDATNRLINGGNKYVPRGESQVVRTSPINLYDTYEKEPGKARMKNEFTNGFFCGLNPKGEAVYEESQSTHLKPVSKEDMHLDSKEVYVDRQGLNDLIHKKFGNIIGGKPECLTPEKVVDDLMVVKREGELPGEVDLPNRTSDRDYYNFLEKAASYVTTIVTAPKLFDVIKGKPPKLSVCKTPKPYHLIATPFPRFHKSNPKGSTPTNKYPPRGSTKPFYSPDHLYFIDDDTGNIKEEKKEELKQRFKRTFEMMCFPAHRKGMDLSMPMPNDFFSSLGDKTKNEMREMIIGCIEDLKSTYPDTRLYINPIGFSKELKEQLAGLSNVVVHDKDITEPHRLREDGEKDVLIATMPHPTHAVGNGALSSGGRAATEENLSGPFPTYIEASKREGQIFM
jgi:hypothetical protein